MPNSFQGHNIQISFRCFKPFSNRNLNHLFYLNSHNLWRPFITYDSIENLPSLDKINFVPFLLFCQNALDIFPKKSAKYEILKILTNSKENNMVELSLLNKLRQINCGVLKLVYQRCKNCNLWTNIRFNCSISICTQILCE